MLVEVVKLYGENRSDPIEIAGRKFLLHVNVDDGTDDHKIWLHMVDERIPVLALKPAYDAEGQTLDDMTAIFIAVELQHEIEDEFDRLKSQQLTASTG